MLSFIFYFKVIAGIMAACCLMSITKNAREEGKAILVIFALH